MVEYGGKGHTYMFKLDAKESIPWHTNVLFAPENAIERRELKIASHFASHLIFWTYKCIHTYNRR